MTDSRSELEQTARRLARRWPIVVTAMVVAALGAVAWTIYSAPKTTYQAVAPVRVINITGNPVAPSPDSVLAAAVSPEARAADNAKLGPEAAAGIGKVSAAVDTKDKTLVRIVVPGADPTRAEKFADAIAHEAVNEAEQVVSTTVGGYARIAEHDRQVAAELDPVIARLQAEVAANPKDASLQLALISAQGQRNGALDSATLYEINVAQWSGDASFPTAAKAAHVSRTGSLITAALQGAIVGLLVGLVIAFVADRMARAGGARQS